MLVLEKHGKHTEDKWIIELPCKMEIHEGAELWFLPYWQVLQGTDMKCGGVETSNEVICALVNDDARTVFNDPRLHKEHEEIGGFPAGGHQPYISYFPKKGTFLEQVFECLIECEEPFVLEKRLRMQRYDLNQVLRETAVGNMTVGVEVEKPS